MTWLRPKQQAALLELQTACRRMDADVVIIGAAAYQAWFEDPNRQTEDVDVAVAIDLGDFANLTETLSAAGWHQELRREHRWNTPGGERIDIIPAGPELRAKGRIDWSKSGMVMSLVGFDHVFRKAVPRPGGAGAEFRVIPVPVLTFLKIASFLDAPHDRAKDIQDVFSMLDKYEIESDRRFDLEVYDAGIDYERAGAYLLGKDVGMLCTSEGRDIVKKLITAARDEKTPESRIIARYAGRSVFEEDDQRLLASLYAFAEGFTNGSRKAVLNGLAKEAFESGLYDRSGIPEGGEDE